MKYFRYITTERNLHFVAKRLERGLNMVWKVRILRLYKDDTLFNNFSEGGVAYIHNPELDLLKRDCLWPVSKKVGRLFEKWLKGKPE